MNIAYTRVSTILQNENRQIEGLKKYNIDNWFNEVASAKDTQRPKLKEMLSFARENDTIFILSFDRLARNTKDLLNIVEMLKTKNITLISSKEDINTSTATGKLMLTMIGAINTFERENMLERQLEGIRLAKDSGLYKGRNEIKYPKNWTENYNKYKTKILTGSKTMKILGLKRTTFYRLVKKYEGEKNE